VDLRDPRNLLMERSKDLNQFWYHNPLVFKYCKPKGINGSEGRENKNKSVSGRGQVWKQGQNIGQLNVNQAKKGKKALCNLIYSEGINRR